MTTRARVGGREALALLRVTLLPPVGPPHPGQGVWIDDGRIAHVGPSDEVRKALPRGTPVLELPGTTLVPGFVDAHIHPLSLGSSLRMINARYPVVSSIRDLVSAVAEAARTAPSGRWIRGRGFDHGKYPEHRMPTRWDIDEVTPVNPVAIVHTSGHFALVNTVALQLAGVADEVPDPQGGRFVRDPAGRLTGMLLDTAVQRVLPSAVDVGTHGPSHNTYPAPVEELVDDLENAHRLLLAAGVTTVGDVQVTSRDMPVYLEARRQDRLRVRTRCMYLSNHLDDLIGLGLGGRLGDGVLSIGGLKIYSDGSLIGGSAAFSAPYRTDDANFGKPYWSQTELTDMVRRAHAAGLQIGIHAQGDVAIEMCLLAFEEALRTSPRTDHRHRLEHFGAPERSHLERVARLGIVPVSQPRYLYEMGDNFVENLGGDRAARLTPLRSQIDMGIRVALGSDAPVASHRPLEIIQSAVQRKSLRGVELGLEERISPLEAFRAYTMGSAHALFMDDVVGSIEPGKVADLSVLGADIRHVSADEIGGVPVLYTIVGGRIAYASSEAPETVAGTP